MLNFPWYLVGFAIFARLVRRLASLLSSKDDVSAIVVRAAESFFCAYLRRACAALMSARAPNISVRQTSAFEAALISSRSRSSSAGVNGAAIGDEITWDCCEGSADSMSSSKRWGECVSQEGRIYLRSIERASMSSARTLISLSPLSLVIRFNTF